MQPPWGGEDQAEDLAEVAAGVMPEGDRRADVDRQAEGRVAAVRILPVAEVRCLQAVVRALPRPAEVPGAGHTDIRLVRQR